MLLSSKKRGKLISSLSITSLLKILYTYFKEFNSICPRQLRQNVGLVLLLGLLQLRCTNIFLNLPEPVTDESILFDAQELINDEKWTEALAKLDTLSAEAKADREVLTTFARTYAGRCGVTFFNITDALTGNATTLGIPGTVTLFKRLMVPFTDMTLSRMNDCITAEAKLLEISEDPSVRTASENFLMVYLSLAKIGAILSYRVDKDDDFIPDSWTSSSGCSVGNGSAQSVLLTSAEARHIGTGVTNFILSFTGVAASLGSSVSDSLDSFTAVCDLPAPLDTICDYTDADDPLIDETIEAAFRVLISKDDTSDIGLETCTMPPDNCTCLPTPLPTEP